MFTDAVNARSKKESNMVLSVVVFEESPDRGQISNQHENADGSLPSVGGLDPASRGTDPGSAVR